MMQRTEDTVYRKPDLEVGQRCLHFCEQTLTARIHTITRLSHSGTSVKHGGGPETIDRQVEVVPELNNCNERQLISIIGTSPPELLSTLVESLPLEKIVSSDSEREIVLLDEEDDEVGKLHVENWSRARWQITAVVLDDRVLFSCVGALKDACTDIACKLQQEAQRYRPL